MTYRPAVEREPVCYSRCRHEQHVPAVVGKVLEEPYIAFMLRDGANLEMVRVPWAPTPSPGSWHYPDACGALC